MTSFRVEVSGMWVDPRMRTQEMKTHVFVVAANGPIAAQVAATQLFGDEAARKRFRALPERSARMIAEPGVEPA
jgi:hypothetical protein